MAKKVATYFYLSIGGNDYSLYVKNMTVNYSREQIEATTSSTTGGKSRISGLYDWSIDVEFFDDLANGGLNETLFALVGVQSAIIAKIDGATTGTSNAKYTGNGTFFDFPMGGSIGTELMKKLTIFGSDGVPLTRAETD